MAKKKSSSTTRSGRGIFDPDYRLRGWNQSKYAPKNGGNNITQASALLITVLMSPCYCSTLVGYEDMEDPANTLAVLIVMSLIGWVLMAIWIRKREWKRLEALLAEQEAEEATTQAAKPATYSRKAQYRPAMHGLQTASDFEHEMAWILNTLSGFEAVVVGGGGDQGVDIELYRLGELVGVAQCKYYNPKRTIAPGYIRELYGVKSMMGVKIAHLFTTARASAQTHELANQLGIKLYDGETIAVMRRKAREKTMQKPSSSSYAPPGYT